jgi:hypothetical protein
MDLPPMIPTATQKLVTIYLDNAAYAKGKMLVGSFAERHGTVEEHLAPQLAEGWRIVSISGFGGSADNVWVRGWFAVLLEKSEA